VLGHHWRARCHRAIVSLVVLFVHEQRLCLSRRVVTVSHEAVRRAMIDDVLGGELDVDVVVVRWR